MNDMETENKENTLPIVEIVEGGPLKITGKIIYRDLKRDTSGTPAELKICLCGRTQNGPFCDDSHDDAK
jgi:CDGSH-type Zn-finger protein